MAAVVTGIKSGGGCGAAVVAMLIRQYREAWTHIFILKIIEAEHAADFHDSQPDLPEVFDACLTELHEEFFLRDIQRVQAGDLVLAVPDQGDRRALDPH